MRRYDTNNSSNNPLFSAERYDQMIELIVNAKLKTPGNGYYSYNQLFKASGSATLRVEDVPNEGSKSLREIVRLRSITGGQGMLKCDCKVGCKTNRCKCKQAKVLCNSRCHHSGTCDNK